MYVILFMNGNKHMKEKKKCSDDKTAAKLAILLYNEQFLLLLDRRQRQLQSGEWQQ
jgi:hypothetical protein